MSKNLLLKLNSLLETGELLSIVDNSLAASQVLTKIGYSAKGQYVIIVRNYLIENEIDISHFTPNGKPLVPKITKICPICKNSFKTEPRKEKEQTVCSYSCSNTFFRSGKNNANYVDGRKSYRNYALNFYGKKCQKCGYDNEKAIIVHHIDKNRDNNEISNLMVLCANCHLIEHTNQFT